MSDPAESYRGYDRLGGLARRDLRKRRYGKQGRYYRGKH